MLTTVRSRLPLSAATRLSTRPAPAFSLVDLGVDETGAPLLPCALNDAGDICASARRAQPVGMLQGYLLRGRELLPQGAACCHPPAASLSPRGQVAGTVGAALRDLRACATHLGVFGERMWPGAISFARGINATGEVVGDVMFDAGEFMLSRAFVVTAGGQRRFLMPPHGGTTSATAINDAGDVVFNSTPLGAPLDDTRAWCLRDQCYTQLPGLGGRRAWGAAITPQGRVTGRALTANGVIHAFLWEEGQTLDLGTLAGGTSEALAANDHRTVVGRITLPSGARRAFRWTPESGMSWLDDEVDAPRGWKLQEAVAINARGRIVGLATYRDKPRGFLLEPAGGD